MHKIPAVTMKFKKGFFICSHLIEFSKLCRGIKKKKNEALFHTRKLNLPCFSKGFIAKHEIISLVWRCVPFISALRR